MSGVVALALTSLALLGQQLVWFEGDQTSAQLPFFGLLVATVLLTVSIAFGGAASGLLRATGTFFLLINLEAAVCLVPPVSSSALWNTDRKNAAYAGGVIVLISVLSSFVAAFTNGFGAPAAGAGSRIASIRGIAFLLATIFLLIASAVQWSWTQQCNPTSRPSGAYPTTNGVLIIVGFVFLTAVLYGDNNTQNLSVFLAATYLLHLGYADPVFDTANVTWPGQSNFQSKWEAAKGLSFIGAVLLLLSVLATGKRGAPTPCALPFDFIAFAIALAGAVCVFVRSPTGSTGTNFRAYHVDYSAAFAIVITVVNLLQGALGLDAGQYISTFFAAAVLYDYDNGSVGTTGYFRGGLQLCQIGVLLSVFLKAFPVSQPLTSYLNTENKIATGFGLVWGLIAMVKVPTNYSIAILLSIITYKAVTSGCPNWSRTAFYIQAFFGIVASFPLAAQGQYFRYTGTNNDYINTLAWLASVYFLVQFAAAGAGTATALDLPEDSAADAAPAAAAADEKPASNEPTEAKQEEGAASA